MQLGWQRIFISFQLSLICHFPALFWSQFFEFVEAKEVLRCQEWIDAILPLRDDIFCSC